MSLRRSFHHLQRPPSLLQAAVTSAGHHCAQCLADPSPLDREGRVSAVFDAEGAGPQGWLENAM